MGIIVWVCDWDIGGQGLTLGGYTPGDRKQARSGKQGSRLELGDGVRSRQVRELRSIRDCAQGVTLRKATGQGKGSGRTWSGVTRFGAVSYNCMGQDRGNQRNQKWVKSPRLSRVVSVSSNLVGTERLLHRSRQRCPAGRRDQVG